MTDHRVLPLSFAFHSTNCETTLGIMLELATEQNLARLLQPCGLAAVACMWPLWDDVMVQVLIDHKHAR